MKKWSWNKIVKEYGLILSASILIFLVSLSFLNVNDCISIIGDEFGYWTSAIFLSGNEWKSLFATNNYYSWGYGVLLAPLVIFFHGNTILMYKMSIIFNALLVVVSFLLCYRCSKNILRDRKDNTACIFISVVAVMYPSYLSFVNSTIVEILLLTLMWGAVNLAFDICKKKTKRISKFVIMCAISIYAYFVHQRCIGMVIATALFGIIVFCGNIKKREIVRCFVAAIIIVTIFGVGIFTKNVYTTWLYESGGKVVAGVDNDYSNIVDNLSSNFSLIPFMKLSIIGAIGKCFYSFVASLSLIVFGIILCINNLNLRKRENVSYLYVILLYLQSIGVSAIFMLDYTQRTDILLYGRYSEYTYSVLIMLGLCRLLNSRKKDFAIALFVNFFFGFIVYQFIPINSSNAVVSGSTFTFARYIFKCMNNKEAILLAIHITSLVIVLLGVMCVRKKQNWHFYIVCSVFIIANICTFYTNYKDYVSPWQIRCNENNELAEFYLNVTDDEILYALDADVYTKMLQYALWDKEIILVDSIEDLKEEHYVITKYTQSNYELIINNYNCVYMNNSLMLWRYE